MKSLTIIIAIFNKKLNPAPGRQQSHSSQAGLRAAAMCVLYGVFLLFLKENS